MQLAAFFKNQFNLGHSAMLINEGLPAFMVDMLEKKSHACNKKINIVGLLGMAFKANNDDARASLSYKVKKILAFQGKQVMTTDPYVRSDNELCSLDEVLDKCDAIILCTPHSIYKDLVFENKIVVDVWNFWG